MPRRVYGRCALFEQIPDLLTQFRVVLVMVNLHCVLNRSFEQFLVRVGRQHHRAIHLARIFATAQHDPYRLLSKQSNSDVVDRYERAGNRGLWSAFNHSIIQEVSRRDRGLAIVELGASDLGVSVDEGLMRPTPFR